MDGAESIDDYNDRMNALARDQWTAKLPAVAWRPEDPMPHVSQMLQSKYLVVQDIPGPVVATIRGCVAENMRSRDGHGQDTKWVLYFNEAKKGLKLNATIIKVLAAAFGETSEAWIGKRVQLYVDHTVQFGGQTVGGIRIRPPKAARTEVGFQTPGAFSAGTFGIAAAPSSAAQPPFSRETGEIMSAPAAAGASAESEFGDSVDDVGF